MSLYGPAIQTCQRALDRAKNRTGMQAGMPKADVDANHLERVLLEHEALCWALHDLYKTAARYNQSPHDFAMRNDYTQAKRKAEKLLPYLEHEA